MQFSAIATCRNGLNLRLGTYTERTNAGRRLLAVRRAVKGGWRRVRAGMWKNRKTGLVIRIQQERAS